MALGTQAWEPSGALGTLLEVHARGIRVNRTGLVCIFIVSWRLSSASPGATANTSPRTLTDTDGSRGRHHGRARTS